MEMSCQLHAPTALLRGRGIWYPLGGRLGGSQRRSERSACRESNPGRPAYSLVTVLAELSRLHHLILLLLLYVYIYM